METQRGDLVRTQLEKILASEGFARNERLCGFLRFVVEQELTGRGDQLKESLVGVEVFGRRPDYDVRQDSVVRTEASKLRSRLTEYYANRGTADSLVIQLPKGGYKPVFRQVAAPADLTPRGPALPRRGKAWLLAGIVLVVAIAVLAGWWTLQRQKTPFSIAVLPLINLNEDPASDYFSDGLTGEIIHNLSIIDGVAVRSQTSSFAFKGKPQNIRDAANQLHAEYIVEGSVLRADKKLRINARLIRARDDFPLWSGQYDRQLVDIFAIQDEISRGIVNSLRLKLGRGRRRYEASTEAYDLYLRGRAIELPAPARGRNRSAQFYEKAIAIDAAFAPAYAALAAAYVHRTGESGPALGAAFDRAEELRRMHLMIAKALELDPLLAEAYAALGMVQARDGQWEQSEKSFRRALELEPNRSLTRIDFGGYLLLPLGRIEEAVAQTRLAESNDPLSPNTETALSYRLFSAGRFEEAAAHCPQPCPRALFLRGRAAEAIPILEAMYKDHLTGMGDLGYAYALAGRREDAERIAGLMEEPIGKAEIFAGLGNKDRAFDALERAIPFGPVRLGRDLTWPEFASLRGDPRLKALRKKVGLPE